MKNKILIVGGYGAVGGMVAHNLSLLLPNQVVVAGRNFSKAEKFTKKLDNRVVPRLLDVENFEDTTILNDVQLVIVCLDINNTAFVEACILSGATYLDISAQYGTLKQIEAFDAQAKANQAAVILSVGLAPGMTNLLAQYAHQQLLSPIAVNIFVLLGLGEKHGEQAYRWTFNHIDSVYKVASQSIKSFTSPYTTDLVGKRTFYTFDFSDQHVLVDTFDNIAVNTRMAFDVRWFTKLTAILRKIGIAKFLKNKNIQDLAIKTFHKFPLGTDMFGVKVEASGDKGQSIQYTFTGRNEGKVTAAFTTEIALYLLSHSDLPTGVSHSHQIIKDIPAFIDKVIEYDDSFTFNYSSNH